MADSPADPNAPAGPEVGVARAASQLGQETSNLVRRELQAARIEFLSKLGANIPALVLIGAAGVLSVLSVASTHRWILRLLEKRLPPATAALLAALGFGAAAGAAGVSGAAWLRAAPAPLPTETARDASQVAVDATRRAREGSEGT
jgi:hypothetical protein